jgi:ERCC4-related helicase
MRSYVYTDKFIHTYIRANTSIQSMHQQKIHKRRHVYIHTTQSIHIRTSKHGSQELGENVVALHSGLKQQKRLASLDTFRCGRTRILVATDVASRGLDIPKVELVINYDIPKVATDYIHRVSVRCFKNHCQCSCQIFAAMCIYARIRDFTCPSR